MHDLMLISSPKRNMNPLQHFGLDHVKWSQICLPENERDLAPYIYKTKKQRAQWSTTVCIKLVWNFIAILDSCRYNELLTVMTADARIWLQFYSPRWLAQGVGETERLADRLVERWDEPPPPFRYLAVLERLDVCTVSSEFAVHRRHVRPMSTRSLSMA